MLCAIPGLTIDNLLIIFTMIDRSAPASGAAPGPAPGAWNGQQPLNPWWEKTRSQSSKQPVAHLACPQRKKAQTISGMQSSWPACLWRRHDEDSKWARYWRSLPDTYYTGG